MNTEEPSCCQIMQAKRLELLVHLEAANIYTHSNCLVLLSPKADTHFTVS